MGSLAKVEAGKGAQGKQYFLLVATNRRARHDYHILESCEAGIELRGSEAKSLRQRTVNFADAYAMVDGGECRLVGLNLTPYVKSHVQLPDPLRRRRLLLKKREIARLQSLSERSGYTLIPLEIYFRGSWAKVKLGVCRGKREYDKRAALKAAEAEREMARAMRGRRRR